MKMSGLLGVFLSLACVSSCKTSSRDPETNELSAAARDLLISDKELSGLSFNFCPEKKSFNLTNALWLSYFSANQYTHFKELGPALDRLGFGAEGGGEEFRRFWYQLRLKKISEGIADVDDTWTSESERFDRYKQVESEYRERYGKDFADDGVRALAFEERVVWPAKGPQQIGFYSGSKKNRDGANIIGSNQAFYAEHRNIDVSVLAFRGTETDERVDVTADLNLFHGQFDGFGAAHRGFINSLAELEGPLLDMLKERSKAKPINLWITGHSLGAAIATLFAARIMDLHERGELLSVKLVGVYHLGSPRIGDIALAQKFDELIVKQRINYIRFRNYKDIVTTIPFGLRSNPGYWHVGALGYFDQEGKLHFGDGWEKIDGGSDILQSTPNSSEDHQTSLYWDRIKRAYLQAPPALKDCQPLASDKPLLPYEEYSALRMKSR